MYLTCITITQSTIITSPIVFNIGLTNVDARLKQRCINVVPTLCHVVSMLFQRRALTLYQRCAMLKIRCRILFHFQHRILTYDIHPMIDVDMRVDHSDITASTRK